MKYYKIAIFVLVSIGVAFAAWSLNKNPHQFSDDTCWECHVDMGRDASKLSTITSAKCVRCHADAKQTLSHPVDIVPHSSTPGDMPLVDGKVSCYTCHFVHPFSIKSRQFTRFLLRRPGRGPQFCGACHVIDGKGHIVFENVHQGSFQVTDRSGTLDRYTLQCVECHDRHLNVPAKSLRAGKWQHFATSRLNHPVGVSLVDIASRKPREFNPPTMLPREIRLFNGKVGCGTCHNVYSKEKYMLSVKNWRGRLCLECHIK